MVHSLQTRFALLIVLLGALVASACNLNTPPPSGWCYKFDFTTSAQSFTLDYGSWVNGVGLVSDSLGRFHASYSSTLTVQPASVVLGIARAPGDDENNLNISGNWNIFGVTGTSTQTLPPGLDSVDLGVPPPDAGTIGSTVDLSASSSEPIALTYVEVQGNDVNPFGVDNCSPPTPSETPSATALFASNTPTTFFTSTSTPSLTPTGTLSVTPSITPSPTPSTWCVTFNFLTGDSDFSAASGVFTSGTQPSHVPGTGWINGIANRGSAGESNNVLSIGRLFPGGTYTDIALYATGTEGVNVPSFGNAWGIYDNSLTTLQQDTGFADGDPIPPLVEWTGSMTLSGGTNLFFGSTTSGLSYRNDSSTPDGSGAIYKIIMRGSGATNPFASSIGSNGYETCGTPTATPTITLTPSLTPSPTHTVTPFATGTPGTLAYTPIHIVTPSATVTPAPTFTLPPSGTLPPPLPTRTNFPSPTAIMTRTPNPTATPNLTSTPEMSATPEGGSGGTGGIANTVCGAGGNDVDILTCILQTISGFFAWVINSVSAVVDWAGSVFAWIAGTLSNIFVSFSNLWQALLSFIQFILTLINQIFAILQLVIDIIIHLMQIFIQWLDQWVNVIRFVVQAYLGAFPEPIPFLPQCATAPGDSSVCAVYYMLQYTVLGGTVGQLIIPLIAILIDLNTIFYFIIAVRNLLKYIEGITWA